MRATTRVCKPGPADSRPRHLRRRGRDGSPATRLTVLSAVAATALVIPQAQAAKGETCQGKQATIVQTTGTVEGTEGDDVIVGGSDTKVHGHEGDDTICVTGGRVTGDDGRDSVEMRGTELEDFVLLTDVEVVDVETGGGPDRVRIRLTEVVKKMVGRIDGGDGLDVLSAANDRADMRINLADGWMSIRRDTPDVAVSGFENASAEGWNAAAVFGDGEDNRLWAGGGCFTYAEGGSGDDVIIVLPSGQHESCWGLEAHGQRGNDVLRGGSRVDFLYGGRGRDRALGGEDEDLCRAEVRRDCELRRRPS
jgi:Ca2+-binding RTX toxin-like protein